VFSDLKRLRVRKYKQDVIDEAGPVDDEAIGGGPCPPPARNAYLQQALLSKVGGHGAGGTQPMTGEAAPAGMQPDGGGSIKELKVRVRPAPCEVRSGAFHPSLSGTQRRGAVLLCVPSCPASPPTPARPRHNNIARCSRPPPPRRPCRPSRDTNCRPSEYTSPTRHATRTNPPPKSCRRKCTRTSCVV
jgi:hypothetical protein